MRIGLGVLRMSPAEFWASTIPELVTAADGFALAHGHDPDDAGVSEADIRALEERCRSEGLID